MKLSEYLDGMRAATTAAELEAAIQADFKHSFRGRTWSQICKVRIEAGERICACHPRGDLVPRFGPGRRLTVCGESYKVVNGGNSTGVRYVWHYAGEWAMKLMRQNGLGVRASHQVWDCWSSYPHRCLPIIEKALTGEIPDPELDVLREPYKGSNPINYSRERNIADKGDQRAMRHCPCGGTLFDWGAGYSQGFDFINWHCDKCPDVYTEYLSPGRLREIRQAGAVFID